MNRITFQLHGDSFSHFGTECETKDSYNLSEVVSHCKLAESLMELEDGKLFDRQINKIKFLE